MSELIFDAPTPPDINHIIVADVRRFAPDASLVCPEAATVLLAALAHYHPRVYAHSIQVAQQAGLLALVLGYEQRLVHQIWLAGLLHDVGLINIPRATLNKQGSLTHHERDMVIRHPLHSVQLLAVDSLFHALIPIVIAHHERPNGHGYPHRLPLHAIPTAALMLASVDAADQLEWPIPRATRSNMATLEAMLRRTDGRAPHPAGVRNIAALLHLADTGGPSDE